MGGRARPPLTGCESSGIHQHHVNVLAQSLALGLTQIVVSVSVTVNAAIAMMAGSIASFLKAHPSWALIQRWLMGTVLAGLAVRMAVESRR
jgi:threonine/homoserine/homoserine lactone efflux protein